MSAWAGIWGRRWQPASVHGGQSGIVVCGQGVGRGRQLSGKDDSGGGDGAGPDLRAARLSRGRTGAGLPAPAIGPRPVRRAGIRVQGHAPFCGRFLAAGFRFAGNGLPYREVADLRPALRPGDDMRPITDMAQGHDPQLAVVVTGVEDRRRRHPAGPRHFAEVRPGLDPGSFGDTRGPGAGPGRGFLRNTLCKADRDQRAGAGASVPGRPCLPGRQRRRDRAGPGACCRAGAADAGVPAARAGAGDCIRPCRSGAADRRHARAGLTQAGRCVSARAPRQGRSRPRQAPCPDPVGSPPARPETRR